jgi:O-antigen/teichoic acid export membrane protein
VGLCLALSGTLLAAAAGAQHQALLERRMRLGPLAVCRLVGQLAGGAGGIAAAFAGWGVWALVLQQYLELVVLDVCVWLVAGWTPRGPAGCEAIGELLGFGGYFAGSNLLFFLALHLDKVLLAAVLGRSPAGQAALGMYTQAFQLMFRPVYLVINPIAGVMLPGLSRAHQSKSPNRPRAQSVRSGKAERTARTDSRDVQDNGYERMVVEFYRMIGIVLLPGGLGLWLVARDVMPLLGGAKWTDAGLLLEAFAPAILVQGFISLAGSVFASAGRADRLFWGAAVATLLLLQGYAAGCWLGLQYGQGPMGPALGLAWSYSLVNVLILAGPYLVYCFRSVGVRPGRVLRGLRGPLVATLCMGLLVGGLRHVLPAAWPLAWQLTLLVATGVLSYSVLARNELAWMWRQLAGNRHGA